MANQAPYKDILVAYRRRPSTITRELPEEFYSDRSRIIFSTAFRRLLHKTQVFPLDSNSSVRTRLTHSLEVADVGKTMSLNIAEKLVHRGILESELVIPFITIVENACLLHDIGNPPFGHFGEESIKRWFADHWADLIPKSGLDKALLSTLVQDFLQFDGNPQGLRLATRLLCESDEYGLNLSLPTILACIKYPRSSDEEAQTPHKKKVGYFQSEKQIIHGLCQQIGWDKGKRFPLAYIMEAADDICYCLSDIADAFEKKLLDSETFKSSFTNTWQRLYPNERIPITFPETEIKYFGMQVSVQWAKKLMNEAVARYIDHHDEVFSNALNDLVDSAKEGRILTTLKVIAREQIYRLHQVQNIELAGHATVYGLLDAFSPLLEMQSFDFTKMVNDDVQLKGMDLEWRLYNMLSRKFVKSYKYQLEDKSLSTTPTHEWFLRAHLIVDYISGMSDDFAVELYRILKGVSTSVK